jgi:hypothetical protein
VDLLSPDARVVETTAFVAARGPSSSNSAHRRRIASRVASGPPTPARPASNTTQTLPRRPDGVDSGAEDEEMSQASLPSNRSVHRAAGESRMPPHAPCRFIHSYS